MLINRRYEIEIISDILKLTYKGAKKTEIIYQGNFSYAQLKIYLSFFINIYITEENEIVDNEITTKFYKTTDKGLIFLKDAERLSSHFDL